MEDSVTIRPLQRERAMREGGILMAQLSEAAQGWRLRMERGRRSRGHAEMGTRSTEKEIEEERDKRTGRMPAWKRAGKGRRISKLLHSSNEPHCNRLILAWL